METGNAILDGIVSQVAQDGSEAPRLSFRLLRLALEALSSSGIPGLLYLRSQHSLANRVGRLLESAGSAV
jgi:hypothetical protein